MEPSNRWFHHGGYYTKKERFKIMKRTLTKTDCGELEFQLGFYTKKICKVLACNENFVDVAFYDDYCLSYIGVISMNENGLKLHTTFMIHESIEDEDVKNINRGLEKFNWLWME